MALEEPLQLHFVMFPLMAQGHMIPMMDIAKLLLQHKNVTITVVTTPSNASRFTSTFARYHMRVLELPFPSKQAGLPEGLENMDMLPSTSMTMKFLNATKFFCEPVEKLLEDLTPPPSCIVSDMNLSYTRHISSKFNVPRISFGGVNNFFLLCQHCIHVYNVSERERETAESDYFVLPGVPDRLQFTKAQILLSLDESWKEYNDEMMAAEAVTYGVIMNSFQELEPAYAKEYSKVRNNKVWCIGPVSLSNKDQVDKVQRGKSVSMDEWHHLKWLDLQKPESVIYACLGSVTSLIPLQLIELGLALEASRKPFIWVIREGRQLEALEKWMKEDGFEERCKDQGVVIRGWAPQLLILSHPSIGGFITHCGWNSTLEAVCAGVPMLTWPQFGDQFFNEKLIVQILKVGVRIGVECPVTWGKEEEIGVLIKKEDVQNAIEEFMDESIEKEERRKRIRELAEMAKKAVEKGGSSHSNVTLLIQDIMQKTKGDI
ncbi:hypothetical protein HN51_050213 [Arachis hypogaea]|uniref:Glycosyltransferase n=1 Tax=Arachis hypogaea TaxID=3818 RepID=A0A444YC97_ARAHY|nr:UDP-glycosyltransferase 73C3 [Arachis ipaensis]XP_025667154.1 UDP-glycosyltransferase 73C3 [Arachis hypogaea]QHN91907.1 UDP-glycosyltransferase [Arachis hypogaea]RYQ99544.1 hypothetical protein Ahy_B07g087489 [Arachis hypogaea]